MSNSGSSHHSRSQQKKNAARARKQGRKLGFENLEERRVLAVGPTAGFGFDHYVNLSTTEAAGATHSTYFMMGLTAAPTANVSMHMSSSNTNEGTFTGGASELTVTFTPTNFQAQKIVIDGVDDNIADGDVNYQIQFDSASSSDARYNNLKPANITIKNIDNDTAGFTINPLNGLLTTEAGGQDTFTVKLTSQPTASVTIPVSSSKTSEGTIDKSSLTFTTSNWNTPQTVTLTGVDDSVDDGDQAYTIVLGADTTTSDTKYKNLNPADVSATNKDNDVAGFTVTPQALKLTEAAGASHSGTYTVHLNSQPTGDVSFNIQMDAGDTAKNQATWDKTSLTFTPTNWNIDQTVTVTAVDDAIDDGDVDVIVRNRPATSTDSKYDNHNPANVTVTNIDDDTAGITVSKTTGLVTTEAGGTDSFTVVLDSQPLFNVQVPVASSNTAEGKVSTAGVLFTPSNWNIPQTVTITGQDDFVADGDQGYKISTGPSSSTDLKYKNLNAADVSVTNKDNDTAGMFVTKISGHTSESGATATFSVRLSSQPLSQVVIPVQSNNTAEGTVGTSSLTFTTANWSSPQLVTVTGVDDLLVDGNQAYKILTGPASSSDTKYNNLNGADVNVVNDDNDVLPSLVSFTVQNGEVQRSFVSHLEVQFNGNVNYLQAMVNAANGGSRIRILRYNLDGSGPAVPVDITGKVNLYGTTVIIDFGANGIGGNKNSSIGDGYYSLDFDLDGVGSNYEHSLHFYRILGDVTGESSFNNSSTTAQPVVQVNYLGNNQADLDLINANYGKTTSIGDTNGDGKVDQTDRVNWGRSRNKSLAYGLPLDDFQNNNV